MMVQSAQVNPLTSNLPMNTEMFDAQMDAQMLELTEHLNQALALRGVTATMMPIGSTLHLKLEATRSVDKATMVALVLQVLTASSPDVTAASGFRSVQISAVQAGSEGILWDTELSLPAGVAASQSRLTEVSNKRTHSPSLNLSDRPVPGSKDASLPIYTEAYRTQWTTGGCRVDADGVDLASLQVRSRPHPLPLSDTVGQSPLLSTVKSALNHHALVMVQGEAGIGKTTLLRSLTHDALLQQQFPDGVVYQSVAWRSPSDLLQCLVNHFFVIDTRYLTLAEIQQLMQGKRSLILLDDVSWPAEDIESLGQHLPGLSFVVATQAPITIQSGAVIPLPGLSLADGVELLNRAMGRRIPPEQHHTAATICHLLQGHPLRILQAAVLVSGNDVAVERSSGQVGFGSLTLTTLVEQLQTTSLEPLLLRYAGGRSPQRGKANQQTRQALAILAVLAVLEGASTTPSAMAAIIGVEEINPVLSVLIETYLVLMEGDRLRLAPNLLTPLKTTWNLHQWTERTVTCFTSWANQASADPSVLGEDLESLWHLTQKAVATSDWQAVLQLGQPLDYLFWQSRQWSAWGQILSQQQRAAQHTGQAAIAARASHQLGSLALLRGQFASAQQELSQSLNQRLQVEPGAAPVTRWNLALVQAALSSPDAIPDHAPNQPPFAPSQPNGQRKAQRSSPRTSNRSRTFLPIALFAAVVGGGGLLALLLLLFPGKELEMTASRDRLDFAPQPIHTRSDPQPVTLRNDGGRDVTLVAIEPEGATANDFQVTENCTDAPLVAGEDCTVAVSFTPQAMGDRQATLWLTDDQGKRQSVLLLAGQGMEQPAEQTLRITPGNVDFGEQVIDSRSAFQIVTLHNDGTEAIALQAISPLGEHQGDFWSRHTCTDTPLQPGESCTVEVVFQPRDMGVRNGRLAIASELSPITGTRQFWTIPLRGEGRESREVEEGRGTRGARGERQWRSPSSPSSPPSPPPVEDVATPTNPPQINEFTTTQTTITAGESAELCYSVTDAVEVTLAGRALNSEGGCLTISPTESRSYTLVATGADGQQVERTLEITVTPPAPAVSTIPTNLYPGSADAMQIPDLAPCNEVILQWANSDASDQNLSLVTIQEQEFPYTGDISAAAQASTTIPWITVFEEPIPNNSLDISQQVGSQLYRWTVRSQSSSGELSDPAPWQYFICSPDTSTPLSSQ